MFTAREVIGIAIQIEENGEQFYRQAIEVANKAEMQDLLKWLADEEARHGKFFIDMKDSIVQKTGDDWAVQIGEQLLQGMVKDRAFSLEEVRFAAIETDVQLIEVGLELERDSIQFYELLLSFIDDTETVVRVNEILKEEKRHMDFLKKRLSA
jgi:rubrerythrin